jgi:hypothetical protein
MDDVEKNKYYLKLNIWSSAKVLQLVASTDLEDSG